MLYYNIIIQFCNKTQQNDQIGGPLKFVHGFQHRKLYGSISSKNFEQLLREKIPNSKKTVKSSVSFSALGTHGRKSCTDQCCEIDTRTFIKAELRLSFSTCVYCYLCVFKEITLVGSNQRNYFENATACRKHTLKTAVATELDEEHSISTPNPFCFFSFALLSSGRDWKNIGAVFFVIFNV